MTSPRPSPGIVRPVAVAVTAAVLALAWFTSDFRTALVAHHEARALWEDVEPARYSFDYQQCSGMCPSCRVRVTVENARVTHAVGLGQCTEADTERAPTIDDVLDMAAGDRWGHEFEARYDPVWGFPTSVSVQCRGETNDCGTGYGVSSFRALG